MTFLSKKTRRRMNKPRIRATGMNRKETHRAQRKRQEMLYWRTRSCCKGKEEGLRGEANHNSTIGGIVATNRKKRKPRRQAGVKSTKSEEKAENIKGQRALRGLAEGAEIGPEFQIKEGRKKKKTPIIQGQFLTNVSSSEGRVETGRVAAGLDSGTLTLYKRRRKKSEPSEGSGKIDNQAIGLNFVGDAKKDSCVSRSRGRGSCAEERDGESSSGEKLNFARDTKVIKDR